MVIPYSKYGPNLVKKHSHGLSKQIFPRISILVLNFNGLSYLKKCFQSLQGQTYPAYTVYIVDNGSTDNSLAFTQQNYPKVKIISFPYNIGFAEAYNRAVQQIEDDYVVFLNNDTDCPPNIRSLRAEWSPLLPGQFADHRPQLPTWFRSQRYVRARPRSDLPVRSRSA